MFDDPAAAIVLQVGAKKMPILAKQRGLVITVQLPLYFLYAEAEVVYFCRLHKVPASLISAYCSSAPLGGIRELATVMSRNTVTGAAVTHSRFAMEE